MTIGKLDHMARKLIRERDKSCQRCGAVSFWAGLDVSHFVGRAHLITRWDLDNLTLLCRKCHRHLDEHLSEHVAWMERRLGKRKLCALVLKGRRRIEVGKALWLEREFERMNSLLSSAS